MEMWVHIPFHQLLALIRRLTPAQKAEVQRELAVTQASADKAEYIAYLMKGPVYAEEDIKLIEDNRESISAWRTRA